MSQAFVSTCSGLQSFFFCFVLNLLDHWEEDDGTQSQWAYGTATTHTQETQQKTLLSSRSLDIVAYSVRISTLDRFTLNLEFCQGSVIGPTLFYITLGINLCKSFWNSLGVIYQIYCILSQPLMSFWFCFDFLIIFQVRKYACVLVYSPLPIKAIQ